jgi:hypothetical protein
MADWRSVWREPQDDWGDDDLVGHMVATAMGYMTKALDETHMKLARQALMQRMRNLREQAAQANPKD